MKSDDSASGQKRLEEHLARTMQENNEQQADTFNGMMQSEAAGCSYDDGTLSLAFTVQDWQVNRVGTIHGGVICTAFDMTIAALARFYAGKNFAPTVSLDVKYIRPLKVGDVMVVTAKATSAGRRIIQLTGKAVDRKTGKLVATAASIYLNVDTSK